MAAFGAGGVEPEPGSRVTARNTGATGAPARSAPEARDHKEKTPDDRIHDECNDNWTIRNPPSEVVVSHAWKPNPLR